MESDDQQLRELKENYARMTEDELCALADDAGDLTEIAREALKTVIRERGFIVRLELGPPAPPTAKPPEDDEGLIHLTVHGWPANAEQARLTMGALATAGIPSFLGPDHVMHLEEFRGKFDGTVSLKIREVDQKRASLTLRAAHSNDDTEEDPEDKEGLINFRWLWNAEQARLTMGALSAAGIPSFVGPDHVMHLEEFRGKFDSPVSLKVRDVDEKRAEIALRKAADTGWWGNDEEEPKEEEEKEYAILCPKCRSAKVVMAGRDTDNLEKSPPKVKFQWGCDACGYQWVDDGFVQEVAGGQLWEEEEEDSGDEEDSSAAGGIG